MSLLSATRATSRRTGSNPLMITASGVSSTMRSIPVACCRARMLRPSLPMMRPLSSSVGSDPLDRLGDDLSGSALAFVASSQLGLPHLAGDLVARVLFDLAHQDALSLLPRHVGDALKLLLLLAIGVLELGLDIVQPLLLAAELALPTVEVLALPVEVLLLLEKALFDLLRLDPVLPGLLLGGGANFDGLLFGLQQLLLGLGFGLRERHLGLGLEGAGPVALAVPENQVRHPKAGEECHHGCHEKQYVDVDRHVTCTSFIRLSKCGSIAGCVSARVGLAL